MENFQFKINDMICSVIATYHDDETGKDYMVYTDGTKDVNDKLKIYYSLYQEVDNQIKLINITSKEDESVCLEMLKELLK